MHPHGRFDFSAFSRKLRIIAQQLENALQVSVISIRLLLAEYPAPFPINRSDVFCGLARQPINHDGLFRSALHGAQDIVHRFLADAAS